MISRAGVLTALVLIMAIDLCTGQNITTNSTVPGTVTTPAWPSTFPFDCRRSGVACNDGNCNLESGKCNCPAEKTYDCGANTTCPDDKYGTTCQLNRVQVFCDNGKMYVNINPHGIFEGKIYVKDKLGCSFNTTVSSPPGYVQKILNGSLLEGWSRELNNEGGDVCGNITDQPKGNVKGQNVFIRQIMIQYNGAFRSSVDQLLTAECTVSNGTATVGSYASNITDNNGNYNEVNAGDEVKIITLEIHNKNGNQLKATDIVLLGEPIQLLFTMLGGSRFVTFQLTNCIANNMVDNKTEPAKYAEVIFLQNGCPTKGATALFSNETQKFENPAKIIMHMKAFMFTGSSTKVAFMCQVTVCDNVTSNNCQMSLCPGIFSRPSSTPATGGDNSTTSPVIDTGANGNSTNVTSSRRKRASGNEVEVSASMSVKDPLTKAEETIVTDCKKAEEMDCIDNPSMLALVIILAVSVILLLILCVILTCRLMRSRTKTSDHQSGQHGQPVQTVRIPRLELSTSSPRNC